MMGRCTLPEHFVWAASTPGEPGAHALCVDEEPHRGVFAEEEMASGSTLQRVSCDRGQALMKEYFDWCERQDAAEAEMKRVRSEVEKIRRAALALPLPRNKCPGCFSAIYDGAAEQGWCCDCYPQRARYIAESVHAD